MRVLNLYAGIGGNRKDGKNKQDWWTIDEQIKDFRGKCRKHNIIVSFKIDPEVKA